MLWEIEIHPAEGQQDREGARIYREAAAFGATSIRKVRSARSYLVEGDLLETDVSTSAARLLADGVVERCVIHALPAENEDASSLINVLFKPGVTDNVGSTASRALQDLGLKVDRVATCRKYWLNEDADERDVQRLTMKVVANDSIERVIRGPLPLASIAVGGEYRFSPQETSIRELSDDELVRLSKTGQLYLSLVEMQTIQKYFLDLGREPTDIELETIAQTWSEHCSHKTLAGRIAYRDEHGERTFQNMLKETIFAATQTIRKMLGDDDWCVSVFKDNAGIVTFDEKQDVCIKVETHNHPSALEPYGGANTGIGGVIRDPIGTGMGARPVCNTDVFCFAPPDTPHDTLPPGVLHPKSVMQGVVAGVRDYGNRMGIPTVNGAVYFDERYLGNPLVYCGNIAMIPRGMSEKHVTPGDYIVAVGGRTGRDGIHGATFSSAELTHESEELSGGAVQIGNAITEKMLLDVILEARDKGLYNAITDCGAGGFSSAVGEMGEKTGAEVWLEKAPLKYSGLTYTEIWISEAQERMVLAVPPNSWEEFESLCASEGVEATIIGRFTDTQRLVLSYDGAEVGNLDMAYLHDGRPPVVRQAVYQSPNLQGGGIREGQATEPLADASGSEDHAKTLKSILSSLNVCSKEWVIRQYDHEVQAGSVVKPLVGITNDGPSDAAVVRPDLMSNRGLVISCGMNPRYGDIDPYWMAAAAIDEAMRNCVAVGADPEKIAILDNFCWGNTERPETLGSLVRAALGCQDTAIAFGTPFVSGKDSLNNEFTHGERTISIPPSLLITALGQVADIRQCVTMDLKEPGNVLFLIGDTKSEFGGSHYHLSVGIDGGEVPRVDMEQAPRVFAALHEAITSNLLRSCHDLSEGGLAVAIAEMAFAGGYGVDVSLGGFGKMDDTVALFSESCTRFVVEVPAADADRFEELIKQRTGRSAVQLGLVTEKGRVRIVSIEGNVRIDESIDDLKECWQRPLNWE
ncbi:MAG: phosphoribosylformylglycinamidine synthase subunit PurL [Planctomycetaceae bacterium]|nr:phosphoribosylformylglycinamidine synthase subunit PurL [Planctomycetaceae bacterium]